MTSVRGSSWAIPNSHYRWGPYRHCAPHISHDAPCVSLGAPLPRKISGISALQTFLGAWIEPGEEVLAGTNSCVWVANATLTLPQSMR